MKTIPLISSSWPFLFILIVCSCIPFVSTQCLRDQKSLLLELKNNLAFAPNAYDKLEGWNQSTDYCHWSGVTCDNSNGRVIGLDLSSKDIICGIDDSSSLYHLQFLQTLNLANNNDLQGEIPSRIGTLSSLTYLNLSWVGFSGQVPIEISNLVKLVVLDISNSGVENAPLYMHKPNLATIIRNLTNIKELYLDYVNNSAVGDKWCKALSSSLPRLQVISMSNCDLRGEIHKSLSNLRHLSVIMLDDNGNMGGRVPGFMAKFTNLTKLSLSVCGLYGIVPSKNFQVPTLRTLDLSGNEKLQGNLPVFYKNGSLEELCLSSTNFSAGTLPSSISNLKRLRAIDLSRNQFFGIVPSSLSNLKRLLRIDLSYNQFSGPIPSFSSLMYLKSINLRFNNLNGSINATDWDRLLSLEELNLSYNSLDGKISTSLFSLPSLQLIDLYKNKFSGQLNEFARISSSQISYLDLRYNSLEGPIPKSFFQLRELQFLYMSFNRLNGTLDLADFLQRFKSLKELDLSFNRLSVGTNDSGENSTFPQLQILFLASCNLRTIPKFLNNQTSLQNLDLSMNQITGTIPEWMWKITRFNLSFNHLVELEPPLSFSNNLGFIDLSSNNLQGKFPVVKSNYYYLDCSNNNFTSINPDIGNYLSYASYMSFSRNNLLGIIPTSLCSAKNLELLNLEHNHLGGTVPDCFATMTRLIVLNLRGNQLDGEIPDRFTKVCSLQTLDLNSNFMQGRIPRSLAYCKDLKVLDLGNNQLTDTFPCHLNSLFNLQVLVLHSNKLHGTIVCPQSHSIWPLLQIMDVASNHFVGELKSQILFKWRLMMAGLTKEKSKSRFLQCSGSTGDYYQNSVSVNFKGNTYELQYILTIFTSIDFSNNAFHGELPEELGNLNALVVLNLSYNSFLGHIPSSFGNLSQIESLDLSCNNLSGKIPSQLASLNFLGYLNLSFNRLLGKIPTGTQLQSFNASSYEGNQGLYGLPLTTRNPIMTPPTSSERSNWSSKNEQEWMLRGAEVGFSVGITIFVGPILYIKRYREWYCKHLHRLVMKILRREDNSTRARRRRRRRNQQRQRH